MKPHRSLCLCFLSGLAFWFVFLPGVSDCFYYCCLLSFLSACSQFILKLLFTFNSFYSEVSNSFLKKKISICLLLIYLQTLCMFKNELSNFLVSSFFLEALPSCLLLLSGLGDLWICHRASARSSAEFLSSVCFDLCLFWIETVLRCLEVLDSLSYFCLKMTS